jgi:plastocyanin
VTRFALLLAGVVAVTAALAVPPALAADPPEVPLVIENNRFQPDVVKVKAGEPFVLVITNKDGGPEEFESKELRIEKIVPPGKTIRVRVRALKAGAYEFFGEYHEATAKGRIVAE